MKAALQKRVQRYGWDKAANYYEKCWEKQLLPAHDKLIEMANVQPGEHILDTAAGTGLVSFRLAKATGALGSVIATDISDEMINLGNDLAELKGFQNMIFKRMDAENLSTIDTTFDLSTCALGLMYFPDPEAALKEMYRTLRPEGRCVVAVWGSRKKCGWSEIFPIVDKRVSTDVCPMFFNLGEKETLKYPMENAGFKNISITRIETILFYKTDEEACDASFLGGPVAMAFSRFDEKTKEEAQAEYLESIKNYKTTNGYEIPGEFVIGSGLKI